MENNSENTLESDHQFRLSERILLNLADELAKNQPGSFALSPEEHDWLLSGLELFLKGVPLECSLGVGTGRGVTKLATRVRQYKKNCLIQRAAETIYDVQDTWNKAKRIAALLNDTEALKQSTGETERLLLEACEIDCHIPASPEAVYNILTK